MYFTQLIALAVAISASAAIAAPVPKASIFDPLDRLVARPYTDLEQFKADRLRDLGNLALHSVKAGFDSVGASGVAERVANRQKQMNEEFDRLGRDRQREYEHYSQKGLEPDQ